jgi:hypothetical protein
MLCLCGFSDVVLPGMLTGMAHKKTWKLSGECLDRTLLLLLAPGARVMSWQSC